MQTRSALPVIDVAAAVGGQLTRREVVRRLFAAASVGTAWPLVAASHPIHELLGNDAVLGEAEKLGADDWKALSLNAQQNESLIAIADSIVPASTNAQFNRIIYSLLSVDTSDRQKRFVDSLAAIESESTERLAQDSHFQIVCPEPRARPSLFSRNPRAGNTTW